jgi:hypothetical protein
MLVIQADRRDKKSPEFGSTPEEIAFQNPEAPSHLERLGSPFS